MNIDDNQTSMRPIIGSPKIKIPISWDVKPINRRNYILLFTILGATGVALLIATFGFIFSGSSIFSKLLVLPIWYIILLAVRLLIFHEGKISDEYESQHLTDYKLDVREIWDIYDIDRGHPHIVHFASGRKGIFVQFKKDVIQGKLQTVEYDHYEAISEAMHIAQSENLSIVPIDYMDNVGNDERLEDLYTVTENATNTDLKNMLTSIYGNLEFMMQQQHSSFDVVLMYSDKKTSEELWASVQSVISEYMNANYRSFDLLNEDKIRLLAKEMFNLESFSVIKAEQEVLSVKNNEDVIRPLRITDDKGYDKQLNVTYEEEARLNKIKEQEEISKQKKNIKYNNNASETQEDLIRLKRKSVLQDYNIDTDKIADVPLDLFSNDTSWHPGKQTKQHVNTKTNRGTTINSNNTQENIKDPFALFDDNQQSNNNKQDFDIFNIDNQKQLELLHKQADAGWNTDAKDVNHTAKYLQSPGHHPELTPDEQLKLADKVAQHNFNLFDD